MHPFGFETFNIESHWLSKKGKRMDSSFYAEDVIASRILLGELEKNGITIESIDDFSENVFWPGRFKRKYVSEKDGNPFLTPSEVFMFLPKSTKFIIDYPEELSTDDNWLLITRSGTIGRCLIATKLLKTFVLSDDLIRLIPEDEKNIGYIYAYLNTWIGQTLLKKDQYGATVKHIDPDHVLNIPIPRISEVEHEINKKICYAHSLREKAQMLLLEAENLLFEFLELPKIEEENIAYFGGDNGRIIKSFGIKSSELNLRFDVSYHLPILSQIEKHIKDSKYPNVKLGSIIDTIFVPNRFKRPYVKNGIPFLQGSNIPQIMPMDVKYLWSKMKNIKQTLLDKNWILMTRSGTVGKISIVSNLLEGWAASEHILRIICKNTVHPGYIVAFLSSPYGEYQIKGKVYGAVVDEIAEKDTSLIEDIDIVLPPINVQNNIGTLIMDAYNKRDEANKIEKEAILVLENKLEEIAAIN